MHSFRYHARGPVTDEAHETSRRERRWGRPAHHESRCHHHSGRPHGPGFGPKGRARRGNMRAAALALLTERPMHGYEIIQELEKRSGGVWRPSPGSVYPTLQLLEDQGLVKSETIDGRRVYDLTAAGRVETAKASSRGDDPLSKLGGAAQDPRLNLRRAIHGLGAAVRQVGSDGTAQQVDKTLEILTESRKRIYTLLAEGD